MFKVVARKTREEQEAATRETDPDQVVHTTGNLHGGDGGDHGHDDRDDVDWHLVGADGDPKDRQRQEAGTTRKADADTAQTGTKEDESEHYEKLEHDHRTIPPTSSWNEDCY